METSLISKHHRIEKIEVEKTINTLISGLTRIKDDSGEFLIAFDEGIVDDKSWPVWNWPQGVGLFGVYKYWRMTKNESALKVVVDWFEDRMKEGAPPKNVNTMAPLLTMAYLYEDTGDMRYLPYLEEWAEWVMNDMPRTNEHGLQHMTYGPENKNQLWDDTLMMSVLPLAKIGVLLGKQSYIDEAKRQFIVHTQYLMDKKTGLWFHGWTFEGNHNFADALWARGNCWITIAIPEIIEILDLEEDDFFREYVVEVLKKQIHTLAELQDDTGLWHTLLLEKDSYTETSATAGFAYGILKAVRKRYVPEEFRETALSAIDGILNQISEDGQVKNVSVGTAMGMNLDYYRNVPVTQMPYGQSLSILALAEMLYEYI